MMKLRNLSLAVSLASVAATGLVGCWDHGDDHQAAPTTTVSVFDGYGKGCSVTANGIAATEVGNGKYSVSGALGDGAVVVAKGCTDADTGAKLPELKGAAQSGGVAVSPITTLIVAAAITPGSDTANVTATALADAKTKVVNNLQLGSYDPVNPATADYVATVKTNTGSQATMQKVLAVSTLLKTCENAAGTGTTSASAAVTAVAKAVAASSSAIDLKSTASVSAVLTSAASIDTSVAAAINTASAAVVTKVTAIASAADVGTAAGIVKVIASTVLNNETTSVAAVSTIDTTHVTAIEVGVVTTTGATGATGGTGG